VVNGEAARPVIVAAVVLTGEAGRAELLVVGGHGRGELPGMHLGSVATYCIHHAACPVTVVCTARR
jgi:nucleotide-binding universal stress UspA family protein